MKSSHHISTIKALALGSILVLTACKDKDKGFDASGSFEAEETIISAEASGKLEQFDVEEGQILQAGTLIGFVDSTQLYLKKKQLEAQISSLLGKRPDIPTQLASLQEQLKKQEEERERFQKLVEGEAATQKQLDDIESSIQVLKKQIAAQRSSLSITSEGIGNDAKPLVAQMAQIEDQLRKCRIINPVSGTVLTKYAEPMEMTAAGKPLYKIADLSTIILRVYITGDQLPKVKLGQTVRVFTDAGDGSMTETEGIITWINDKAEFTPKTVQTKDERANMVYAVKVNVKNDGTYKIGMYGEIKFE